MQVKVEKTEPCKAHVSFTVPPDEFQAEVRRLLSEVGRNTRLKGFRPGKVPPAVIERLHGKEVRREARQQFVRKAYEQAVGENELRPLSHPSVEVGEEDLPAGEEFGLEFEVTLRPEFELGQVTGLEVESAIVPVSDEEVEGAIAQICKNQARPEPAGEQGLADDGMALCTVELLHEGEVVFSREGLRLAPETAVPGVAPEAFKQAMLGQGDGDVFEVPVVFPSDFEVEAARGRDGACRVSIQQAFRIVEPTREELLKTLELDDDAALVARVREKMEEANVQQEQQRVETELLNRVIEAHAFELPAGMVEQQTTQRLEQTRGELRAQGVPEGELEAELAKREPQLRQSAERSARAFFLIEAITEKHGLRVSDAELRVELKAIAERNRASFDEVAAYYREQQLYPQLAMEIAERKVRTFLREQADLRSPAA